MATTLDLNMVPTYNVNTIGIADISVYDGPINNPSFEVTPPGFPKINILFTPKQVNIYNATHLNIDCTGDSPLPDGIYYFRYSIAPNSTTFVEKSFMRVEQLICKYYNTRLSLDATCSCKDMSKQETQLLQVFTFIEGAIASANQCDPNSAYEKYAKAEKLLKNITCSC